MKVKKVLVQGLKIILIMVCIVLFLLLMNDSWQKFSHQTTNTGTRYRKIIHFNVQSNLRTTASLGTQKYWPLFESGRYPRADHEKLLYTLAGWGLGRLLLTGGRCSEVAINTGLNVYN